MRKKYKIGDLVKVIDDKMCFGGIKFGNIGIVIQSSWNWNYPKIYFGNVSFHMHCKDLSKIIDITTEEI